MTGVLTTIQRFSLHDGPGIRSTVFFKGCNMRCAWCHNPETLQIKSQVMYYPMKCVGCGACTLACSRHTLSEGKMVYDRSGCTDCGNCTKVCFSGALEFCGREYSAEEVLKEVLQDKDYYIESKGGVTLSGGEVLLQSDFALELLKALKEQGISTAIESNMSTEYDRIEKLLPYLDLVMCDLKLSDDEKHKEWTLVGNERIKENIRKVSEAGIPIILRTPVIPGVNDNEEEIEAIAAFAGGLPSLLYYELLNFNPLGGSKYDALSIDNRFHHAKPLSEERIHAIEEAALKHCKNVKVG